MFSTCSVMIVYDDIFARGIIRHHLTRLGFKNVFEASDGNEALTTLRSAKMQLVIADRYMPVLNGVELYCNMQNFPDLKDIPFIMVTMEDEKGKIEDARNLGICNYLVKPFNADMFDAKIHEVLLQPVNDLAGE